MINIYLGGLEALYRGNAQKGFGDPRVEGSPFPLGLKATYEPIEISKSLWRRKHSNLGTKENQ